MSARIAGLGCIGRGRYSCYLYHGINNKRPIQHSRPQGHVWAPPMGEVLSCSLHAKNSCMERISLKETQGAYILKKLLQRLVQESVNCILEQYRLVHHIA
mmetsp:Transcript_5681/g.14776  ORF Transcript_5681/g.14776 Transcript_5681/m.14776 type:complete len:100 (-) Transcript_5681:1132-1431(-)